MTEAPAVMLRGAAMLLGYIREHFSSIPAFCEAHGLDRLKVQRAVKGQMVRVDVTFASEIEEATGGEVSWESWIPDEAARRRLHERRSAASKAAHATRFASQNDPTEAA